MIGRNRKRFEITHFGLGINALGGYSKPQSASDMQNFIVNSEGELEVRRGLELYATLNQNPTHGCQIVEIDGAEIAITAVWNKIYLYTINPTTGISVLQDSQTPTRPGSLQDTEITTKLQLDWIGVPVFLTTSRIYYATASGIALLGFAGPTADDFAEPVLSTPSSRQLKPSKNYRYYMTYLRTSEPYYESEAYYRDVSTNDIGDLQYCVLDVTASNDPQVEQICIYRTRGYEDSEALETAIAYNIHYGRGYENSNQFIQDNQLPDWEEDVSFDDVYESRETFDPVDRGQTALSTPLTGAQLLSEHATTLAVYRNRLFHNPGQAEKIKYSGFSEGDPVYPRFIPTDILTVGDDTEVKRIIRYGNNLAIFKESSIWILTGDDVYSYNLEMISDAHGLVSEDAVCQIGSNLFFVSKNGLCRFSGYTVEVMPIYIAKILNDAILTDCAIIGNTQWLYIAYATAESEHGGNNKVLAYNFERDYFTIFDWNVSQFTKRGEDIYFGAYNESKIYKIDHNGANYTDLT